jgi:large repetitive protein
LTGPRLGGRIDKAPETQLRRNLALGILLVALPAPAGELTGRLTLNDRPAPGITVTAVPYETSLDEARREARHAPRAEAIATTITNAKGEWRFVFEVPLGHPGKIVEFHYAGPGVARGAIIGYLDVADSEDLGEIPLRMGATVSGRVTGADGRPVADAEIRHPDGVESVRTDTDGKFTLDGVAESFNDVVVRKAGFATTKVAALRAGAPAVIVLKQGVPLEGVVLEADGKTPAGGAVLWIEGKDATAFAEADAEGRFAVRELASGRVLVSVDGAERGFREVTDVAIPRPPETPLAVVLAPATELKGRVLDAATRKPIAGASVDAVSGRRRLRARSAADGSFVVRPAPAGDWMLDASAPRYVRASRRIVRQQRVDKPVEIFLREGVTISGRVTDDQRRPVAAARVRATESMGRDTRPPAGSVTVVTAEDGAFTLRRVPAAEALRLFVKHPDFEPGSIGDLGLKPGETRTGVVVSLRRGAALTGVVASGDTPLADAQVVVTFSRGQGAPPRALTGPQWTWPRATTNAEGRFRIGGLAPGDYTVTVSKTGYAREIRDASIAESRPPDPLSFALSPEAVIAGHVRSKRGSGVANQGVEVSARETSARSRGSALTLADGSFRIDGLKPGVTYNVSLFTGMPGGQSKPVVAPAEGVEFTAAGTGRIEGRVVDAEGRPVPEFQVTSQSDRSSSGYGWTNPVRQDVSSETGEFVLENVPAALLEVRVVARGYQPARVGGIAVEDGETRSGVEVKLTHGATLRGRAVESRSGRSIPDLEVSTDSSPPERSSPGVTTDADGAFEIEGLTPGKIRVTARGPDYAPTSEIAEVGESGGTVELKLSPGASVSAIIVSSGGEPQAGVEVTLAQTGQSPYGYGGSRATAGPDGRVRFSHLSPGRYSLAAGTAGRRSKPVEVSVEADQARDDVRVVIGGGATVLATVTGLPPDQRKRVVVWVGGAGVYYSGKELPDGRFEARDVTPGVVQVYARLSGEMDTSGGSVTRQLTVPEEGTVEVELPFEGGFTLTAHVARDGQPAEGVNVSAFPTIHDAGTFGSAITDASGTCRLTGLRAGTYSVMAHTFTGSSAAAEQKIEVSGDRTLEFVLPSGRMAGRVVSSGSGQPLADAQITIRSSTTDGSFGFTHDATTDSAGRFQLSGLPDGPLSLRAQRKGYLVETRSVTADSPDELVIELARGDGLDVTGRDGLLGTPLGSFYVRILDGAGAEFSTSYVSLDSAGRGEITSLKPGAYSMIASSTGYAPAAFDGVSVPGPALAVTLTPGGTLDIEVPAARLKSGPLACRVASARGLPLALRQWGKRGDLSLAGASTHLTNFPSGSGTLTCPGFAPAAFTVSEGGVARVSLR